MREGDPVASRSASVGPHALGPGRPVRNGCRIHPSLASPEAWTPISRLCRIPSVLLVVHNVHTPPSTSTRVRTPVVLSARMSTAALETVLSRLKSVWLEMGDVPELPRSLGGHGRSSTWSMGTNFELTSRGCKIATSPVSSQGIRVCRDICSGNHLESSPVTGLGPYLAW